MIWIGDGLASSTTKHVNRHVQNAQEYIEGLATSSHQGDRNVKIPEELTIDTSTAWTEERRASWKGFLQEQMPMVDVDVMVPIGRSEGWNCSCVDPHSADCQCDCKKCDSHRACDCEKGKCMCPALRNCACEHCTHGPVRYRECADAKCANIIAPGQGIYCRTCTAASLYQRNKDLDASSDAPNQTCATPGCEKQISVGGKSGKYCSKCKGARSDQEQAKKKAAGQKDPNARECATEGCTEKAPVDGGSCYCDECTKECRRKRRRRN